MADIITGRAKRTFPKEGNVVFIFPDVHIAGAVGASSGGHVRVPVGVCEAAYNAGYAWAYSNAGESFAALMERLGQVGAYYLNDLWEEGYRDGQIDRDAGRPQT